jgi:hypothetical protein
MLSVVKIPCELNTRMVSQRKQPVVRSTALLAFSGLLWLQSLKRSTGNNAGG